MLPPRQSPSAPDSVAPAGPEAAQRSGADAACCGRSVAASAGYLELTPQEFRARPDLLVVLVHAPQAQQEFAGFRAVLPLPACQLAAAYLREVPRDQPLGVVCPDGEASARLAIRLAREGYTVAHLCGGLQEWHRSVR